jgi:hypothetical protein
MGRIHNNVLVLATCIGLVFVFAAGILWWKQTNRVPAAIPTPSVADPIAIPAASTTANTVAAPRGEHEPLEASMADIEHGIEELQGKKASSQAPLALRDQDQDAAVSHNPEAATSPTQDHDIPEESVPIEEEVMQADAQVQAQAGLVENTFSAEMSDPEWAGAAEVALQELFQSEDVIAIALVEAECRTTMCRLELAANNAPAGGPGFEEAFRALIHLLPWPGEGFSRIDNLDSESPTAVLYLTREGHFLPQLDSQQRTPENIQ